MRGFVLVELLIVLVILSFAFFYLIPKLNITTEKKQSKQIETLNLIVKKAFVRAKNSAKAQVVWGFKGSNTLHLGNDKFKLPDDIFSCKINGNYEEGLKCYFFVYPDGVVDFVEIDLGGGLVLKSSPLLLTFDVEQKSF